MKKLVEMFVMVALVVFFAIPSAAQHKYVGVTMCSVCHKTEKQGKQFDIWKSICPRQCVQNARVAQGR